MSWFKGDDKLHAHPKTRRALKHPQKRRDAAAMGLWVLAGTWCADHGTGGFVPVDELDRWDDDGDVLAERLVDARLWLADEVNGEPGFRFHDWDHYNPDAASVVAKKLAQSEGGVLGNHKRWHRDRNLFDPTCPFCIGTESVPDQGSDSPPNPPVPTRPDPDPSPVVNQVSQSRAATRELSTDGLEKVKALTNTNDQDARKIATTILARAGANVRNVDRYVVRAIQAEPALYRHKRGNPKKGQECTVHAGQWADACAGCAADRKAAS